MRERALRGAFVGLTVALLAVAAASAYVALDLGYVYTEEVRLALYPALAKGLAPLLGVAVAAALVAGTALRRQADRIEQGLLRWVDAQGGWVPQAWDEEVELTLVQGVQTGQFGYDGAAVQEALVAHQNLLRRRAWAVRLLGVPVTGLAAMVGFSLWAIPASGAFLGSQVLLNTTFVFFTTYGLFVVAAALVIALLLSLGE